VKRRQMSAAGRNFWKTSSMNLFDRIRKFSGIAGGLTSGAKAYFGDRFAQIGVVRPAKFRFKFHRHGQ
jgi:hypothetical protein